MLGFAPAAKSAFAIGLGDKNENLELRAVMEKLGFVYGQRIRKQECDSKSFLAWIVAPFSQEVK